MGTLPTKCVTIRVSGRVQGVFFRASTKAEADRLGINGIVRNEREGSVYIEAEGGEEALGKFIAWCRRGPTHAYVLSFDLKEAPSKGYVGFRIERS